MKGFPSISVIIPTCNRNDLLALCLSRLHPSVQRLDLEAYEVIVTDDSKDNSAKGLINEAFSWVRWVEGPKRGPAANRNSGVRYSRGEWLIFIDDDVLPDLFLIDTYVTAIREKTSVLAFEGAIYPDDWAEVGKELIECPVNLDGGCFWSANICINRIIFNSISGFDELFLIAAQEDQDLYIRLKKVTTVAFVKNAFVTHPVRESSFQSKIRHIPRSLENWIYFSRKHYGLATMTRHAFFSQFTALFNSIKRNHFKLMIYHILVISQIVPMIIFSFFRNRPSVSQSNINGR